MVTNAQDLGYTIKLSGNGRSGKSLPLTPARRILDVSIAYLAAAAVMLFAIGISVGMYWSGRSDSGNVTGGPANHVAATLGHEAKSETLLDVTIPADEVPTAVRASGSLTVWAVPPGTRSTRVANGYRGPFVLYVISGNLTLRHETAVKILRADGSTVDVPANTDVTLGPGDNVSTRIEVRAEASNEGTEPVLLVHLGIAEDPGRSYGGDSMSGWIPVSDDVLWFDRDLQPLPVTLRLSRTAILSDEYIAADEAAVLRLALTTTEDAFVGRVITDGTFHVYGPPGKEVTVYMLTVTQAGSAATPQP